MTDMRGFYKASLAYEAMEPDIVDLEDCMCLTCDRRADICECKDEAEIVTKEEYEDEI